VADDRLDPTRAVVALEIQVHHRADQSQVTEGVREVADLLTGGGDLFRDNPRWLL
jgi:hypothetical protein